MANGIAYSVVIPVFNEEDIINELYRRLTTVMDKLNEKYEIIFVDDGSKDGSFEILRELHRRDETIKIIRFSRNFGHHIAITAGLDYAQGDAIILMDSDLQDPPEEIPKLYEKFKEGYDVVYAIRKVRIDPFLKKLISKLFYRIFKIMSKTEIPPKSGVFRIMSRRVADSIKICREKSRFIIGLISWSGFSHVGVETERDARYGGDTKYNLLKSAKLGTEAITSFSSFPLRIATYIGFFTALCSFMVGIYMLIKKLFLGMPVSGYASIIVSVFFLGGVQLIIMGFMGEYISRTYTEVQDRPLYIIKDRLGFSKIGVENE